MSLERGFLARRREGRGEGEVGRVTERVNQIDDAIERDLEAFPASRDPELRQIRDDAQKLAEKTRGSVGSTLKQWAKKNTMIKMAVASAGIHAAVLTPQFAEMMSGAREAFERAWAEEGAVIRPQSEEEREAIDRKIAEREARIDKGALSSYKAEISEKLQQGEPVTFEELYFSLEEKNGVAPEDVAEAREGAQKMIDEFSKEVGDELSEGEIKDIVKEMYGDKENYDWGQASVTEYFKAYNEGRPPKRNCVTANRAEQIVFEGVIARLPEKERQKFTVGEMAVKQHKIATLTWQDGSEERLFPLEPGQEERTVKPEAGVVKVSATFLKEAAVAEKPVRISAGKGEVLPSPDVDVKTNEPFSSGYATDGPLVGSDFVRAEVEHEEIQIKNRKDDVMEVEIESNGVDEVRDLRVGLPYDPAHRFQAWKMTQRTPEAFKEYQHAEKGFEGADPNLVTLEFGEMAGWTYEEMRQLLDGSPYKKVSFASGISDPIRQIFGINRPNPDGGPEPQFFFDEVLVSPSPETNRIFGGLTGQEVSRVLAAFPKAEITIPAGITLGLLSLDQDVFAALKQARVKGFYFEAVPDISPGGGAQAISGQGAWEELDRFASPVQLPSTIYISNVIDHPEYWKYENIVPRFDLYSADLAMMMGDPRVASYLSNRHPDQETRHQKTILDQVSAKMRERLER